MNEPEYVGDAVYATFDGYGIWLDTRSDPDKPTTAIYLEPAVLAAINRFYASKTAVINGKEE